jgi:Fuc2NAc and GlcNAc transferase
MSAWWLLPAAAFLSFCLTWLVRRYALSRRLIDLPGERSSHRTATTRGGGLAIVLTFLCGLPILYAAGLVPSSVLVAICGGGGLVALIGFADDHRPVPVYLRLLSHFLGAAWALYWLGGVPSITGFASIPAWVLTGLAAFWMVWLVNLYNFMDGIDGIASIEAITVCFGAALLTFTLLPASDLWLEPALLLASVAGFLYWNYPPARIFMGDAGSGFLGFVLAVFCVQAAWVAAGAFWAWIILLGVFVVDASVTLVRRMLRGQKLHEAHRSHGYQYASRKHGTHERISLAVGAINLVWLLPLALLVASAKLDWKIGLAIAYAPLFWLAYRYKSGASETQEV